MKKIRGKRKKTTTKEKKSHTFFFFLFQKKKTFQKKKSIKITVLQAPRADAPAPEEMPPPAPAGRRDLPPRARFHVRDRRQEREELLPEPVLLGENVPRPQDALLRRRSVPLLRPVRVRRARGAHRGVFLKGEAFGGQFSSPFFFFLARSLEKRKEEKLTPFSSLCFFSFSLSFPKTRDRRDTTSPAS